MTLRLAPLSQYTHVIHTQCYINNVNSANGGVIAKSRDYKERQVQQKKRKVHS